MAQPTAKNHAYRGNHKQYAQMTLSNPQRRVVPTAVLTQSKLVPINAVLINAVRPVNTVVPKIKVTRTTQYKPIVTSLIHPLEGTLIVAHPPKPVILLPELLLLRLQ
nr:hypothetical protein [Tanacetum cinerariifolium]